MVAPALADLLPDFGSRPVRGPAKSVELRAAAPVSIIEPQPIVDTTAMIAEEVARAEAAVTERLSAIYEATLEAERKSHAEERDELRRNLGTEAASLIEARFARAEEELLALTTTAAARILGSILTGEMQTRAVAALSAKIREALGERDAVRIRVHGPQLLCEALEAALGEHADSVEFTERASFDLSVNIDSSIYETRFAEWAAELSGVLG